MKLLKITTLLTLSLILAACGNSGTTETPASIDSSKAKTPASPSPTAISGQSDSGASKLDEIMSGEMIGAQRGYFEQKYGPAKFASRNDTRRYEIDQCLIGVQYGKDDAITSIELENISPQCNFNTKDISIGGMASDLNYGNLIEKAMDWAADLSCYTSCGNAADPIYGAHINTSRATSFMEFSATSDYSLSSKASGEVTDFFKKKYPDFDLYGDDLGPIDRREYNAVWLEKFKDVKLTSIKFGYQLKADK